MIDLTTAEWLPLAHDWDSRMVQLVRTTPKEYGLHYKVLNDMVESGDLEDCHVHYNDLPEIPYRKTLYIMHLAYGGSTLISRMLDLEYTFLSTIESPIHSGGRWDGLDKMSRLFSRVFTHEIPVIKTIPTEIRHIDDYLDRDKDNQIILFHQTLENFIISCFNKGSDRRRKAVMHFRSYMGDQDYMEQLSDEDAVKLFIDYWTSMMSCYKAAIDSDTDRVIGLRSEDFFTDPVWYMEQVALRVGVVLNEEELEHMDNQTKVHSKWGTSFSELDRIKQKEEALELARPHLEKHRVEIDELDKQFRFPDSKVILKS